MSVRLFCVDGTNLVRSAYGYGGTSHQAQEQSDSERMVEIFARLCEETGAGVEVELFFDGAFRAMPSGGPANFRLSFTREVPADDVILDRVRARTWNKGGTVTVVTADVELGETAEAEGGKWMRVAHGTSPDRVARQIGGRFLR
ncbi:MAG: NYN domain-containing protein [Elusimicrobia bacterium]|nr:NYN domain-containing protein [Elusimicrobiota bacterium]